MSNRIIARISKENQAAAVIERAKQRFTTLESFQDLSRIKTIFLDFSSKDDNFINILKGDDFPEVHSAIWDRETTITGVYEDAQIANNLNDSDILPIETDRLAVATAPKHRK